MIVAGIDEAGYGPLLGPLVVGCCAFEVADTPATEPDTAEASEQTAVGRMSIEPTLLDRLPCLWKRLNKVVSKQRSKTGRKLHVNDSKMVYSPSTGIKELEKTVLAVSAAWRDWPTDLPALLKQVAPHVLEHLPEYPWYQVAADEVFPISQDGMPIRLFANALKQEMHRVNCRCVHLQARVVLERQLNRQFEATRNKSSVLFSTAAFHLDYLLRMHGRQDLIIFCDRQGGREHYGHLLRLMFEEWALAIVSEADGRSEYQLTRDGHSVTLIFTEKAEAQCMPVAMASMLCKYLRESFMHRFNAYWSSVVPGVTTTAGYHTDGTRFLQDIDIKRRELGIRDEELIRSR